MMKLCYAPGSCATVSHLALEEAGAQYELRRIDLGKGEQRTEAYLKINPNGRVPALILDDGRVLIENIGIVTYLAGLHPDAQLIPFDQFGEARCYSIMSLFASSVHVAWAHNARPERYTTDASAAPNLREVGRKSFFNYLQLIDGWLEGRPWLLDQYSVCDPYALVFYGWGLRGELPVGELKSYTAHKDRMLQRSAVRKVLEREESVLVKS
jgi:glutathione S-transferase